MNPVVIKLVIKLSKCRPGSFHCTQLVHNGAREILRLIPAFEKNY